MILSAVLRAVHRCPTLMVSLSNHERAYALVLFLAATQPAGDPPPGMQQAIFGGGCFWSMEHVFDEIPGVQSVTVGYTGGTAKSPSYEQVELGITGHVEAVRVVFDPSKAAYDTLLDAYWHNTDPTE